MFEYPFSVLESSLIPPYNHVHHADILKFLEEARLAYLESLGFPHDQFLSQGLFLVIAGIDVRYKREVKGGDYIATCEDGEIIKKSLWLTQRVVNAKGKDAVVARIESVFFSAEEKRSIYPPNQFKLG